MKFEDSDKGLSLEHELATLKQNFIREEGRKKLNT